MYDDQDSDMEAGEAPAHVETTEAPHKPDEAERRLVGRITERIRADKAHFKKSFDRMRRDMKIARRGAPDGWPEGAYIANITNRHINQKTAALYAKNPKATARRRPRLDFSVWDESEQTLMQALTIIEQDQMMQAQAAALGTLPMPNPAVQQAMDLLADYQQGMERRQIINKIGKTLEILFAYFTTEQSPVDFKTSMKQVVRRTATTGVGYVKLGFQREFDTDPVVTQRISDFTEQLKHIDMLQRDVQDDARAPEDKKRELELAIASAKEQMYVLVREGLVFDFPASTDVIPDRMCRSLTGFVGARWVTVQHLYTAEEIKRNFKTELGSSARRYDASGRFYSEEEPELPLGDEERGQDLFCVWEHYDRETGLLYLLADGHSAFLRPPSAPDVYVDDFWPIYALTFNEVEDESDPVPPSDVTLMLHMQQDYNRSRQGKREHRQMARPRFFTAKGAFDDEDKEKLAAAEAFTVTELNMSPEADINKLLQASRPPGVDPNLYDPNETMTDIQLVVGSQEAAFGAVAKATATESSIAESSRVASVDSNVDDLDAFLTRIARAAGQIMLMEVSPEVVLDIVGPGAVWPELTLEEIAKEVYLEVEAGSSGKPNQVQEIRNWEKMLPYLVQMPNISPTWLARQTLNRLDDRLDITEAITENTLAIVAQNRLAGAAPAPGALPEDQGGAGADNTAQAGGPTGSEAPMGNNQQSN